MKHISTYYYKGHTYEIVYTQEHYCAIDHKYIDSNGNLNKNLNGLQMYANHTLDGCIKTIKTCIDAMDLKKQGFDNMAIMQMLMG